MNDTYEWLYDNYARDLQPALRKNETEAIKQLMKNIPLSPSQEVELADCMANLRLYCGTKSFALGVQMGLRLAQDIGIPVPTVS